MDFCATGSVCFLGSVMLIIRKLARSAPRESDWVEKYSCNTGEK